MPAEADVLRLLHVFAGNKDGVAVNLGLGRNKLPVLPGDGESRQRLVIARRQHAADVVERNPDRAAFDFHRFVQRAGIL